MQIHNAGSGERRAAHLVTQLSALAAATTVLISFIIIDAGTTSSSPFQRTPQIVHDHAGIVFTFRWKSRSRCAGNSDHDYDRNMHLGYRRNDDCKESGKWPRHPID